jgi:hypothetical protein
MNLPSSGEGGSYREAFAVDYVDVVAAFDDAGFATLTEYLLDELPYVWLDAYVRLT